MAGVNDHSKDHLRITHFLVHLGGGLSLTSWDRRRSFHLRRTGVAIVSCTFVVQVHFVVAHVLVDGLQNLGGFLLGNARLGSRLGFRSRFGFRSRLPFPL
jgi:hypothetical protein